MSKTALGVGDEDWEKQLHTMMSERDAEAISKAFHEIMHGYEPGEPAATLEIAVGEEDIHEWLPAIATFLEETPTVPESVKDMLWNLGLQLIEAYVTVDAVAPHQGCTEAVEWFMGADPDTEDFEEGDTMP